MEGRLVDAAEAVSMDDAVVEGDKVLLEETMIRATVGSDEVVALPRLLRDKVLRADTDPVALEDPLRDRCVREAEEVPVGVGT